MAQIREIKTQIGSIKGTQKITRAMELVAASKMRKAQQRMAFARPYSIKIRQVIGHVAASSSEYHHAFLQQRESFKRVGFIVVSSDRGLCGSLNINLFKKTIKTMKEWHDKGVEIDSCLIGHKAEVFFKRHGGNVLAIASHMGDTPKVEDLIGLVKVMFDKYDQGELDAVFIASNKFINTMNQQPEVQQLLPLEIAEEDKGHHWDYIYEPDSSKDLLDKLLTRYIESQVYQAVIENIACFMAAQMVAMKSATENANELINELQLLYNKARQASITQEIAEIVGGAEAIE